MSEILKENSVEEEVIGTSEHEETTPVNEPADAVDIIAEEAAQDVEEEEEAPVEQATSRRRARSFDIPKAGNIIESENDMVFAEMPEDRRAQDIDEIRRAIGQKKILSCRVLGAEPIGDNSAKIVARRNTLRIVFIAEDFFRYSQMKGIENEDPRQCQIRYLRKARRMMEACVTFVPLAIDYEEVVNDRSGEVEHIPFVIASRADAMLQQRQRHFLGRNADVKVGTRTTASVLSNGPDYIIVEALGVETSIGSGALSAFEYIEDVGKKYRPGMGIAVAVEAVEVNAETGQIDLRLSHALLERMTNTVDNMSCINRGGTYSATVLSVHENYYNVVLNGFKVRGRIARASNISDEMLVRGDQVSMMVRGHDYEHGYVWGACHKI